MLTALESGPATLAGLVAGTGLARPTAHRLAVALEHHRLVARDMQGRFVLGPAARRAVRRGRRGPAAGRPPDRCWPGCVTSPASPPSSGAARATTASASPPPSGRAGLRDTIPVGSQLTMRAGSAAQVLLAWEDPERMHRGLQNAAFSAAALVRHPPPRLGPVRGRARAGRGLGVRAGPLPRRQGDRRRLGLGPARAAVPPARPDARPRGPRRRRAAFESLRRAAAE